MGNSRMEVSVITAPSCVLVVSTCTAFASTVTVSADPPICSVILTIATCPMLTTTFLATNFLNPVASALTLYVPTASSGTSKLPSLSLVTPRTASVPTCVMTITAPWMIAPEGSTTPPRISPVVCPKAAPHQSKPPTTRTHTRPHTVALMTAPLQRLASTPDVPPVFSCRQRNNLTIIRER